jgi:hypothetical protein
MKIVSIKKIETEKVFDIEVDDAHHYILENGIISHNSGLKYSANNIIALSKSKNKDADGTVTGIFIRCKNLKSRLTKENTEASVMLSYDKGLDRYYGLIDLAVEYGIFKKVSTKIEVADGSTHFEKHIINNPEKYFTQDVLDRIDQAAQKEYSYGTGIETEDIIEDILDESN